MQGALLPICVYLVYRYFPQRDDMEVLKQPVMSQFESSVSTCSFASKLRKLVSQIA